MAERHVPLLGADPPNQDVVFEAHCFAEAWKAPFSNQVPRLARAMARLIAVYLCRSSAGRRWMIWLSAFCGLTHFFLPLTRRQFLARLKPSSQMTLLTKRRALVRKSRMKF